MIIKWLKEEIESYFKESTDNRIFLWLDPTHEYEKLLSHISGDFTILKYEKNPLKIRYDIEYSEPQKKWVIYLPISEHSEKISYLKNYIFTSKIFQKTLYKFLQQHGIKFPKDTSVHEIKKNLPKLAVDSIGKDYDFWKNRLFKPGEDIILPDYEQKLFNCIEAPEKTHHLLKEDNTIDIFIKKTEATFGFKKDVSNIKSWLFNFIAHLCIAEIYLKTNKPADFPLRNLLPTEDKLKQCATFIEKVRDSQRYGELYKDITSQIEQKYSSSLRNFAAVHVFETECETFKCTDLIAIEKLNQSIADIDTKDGFIQFVLGKKEFIRKKSKNFWSRERDIYVWNQLATICSLVEHIEQLHKELSSIKNECSLVMEYCNNYYIIDKLYREYRENLQYEEENIEKFIPWVEKLYIEYLDKINSKFTEYISKKDSWILEGVSYQGDFLNKFEKKQTGKCAIFMVDALRYDIGKGLEKCLKSEYNTTLEPMYAQIPTTTPIGMSFLLSPQKIELTFDDSNISVINEDNQDLSNKEKRKRYLLSKLKNFDTIELKELIGMGSKSIKKINKSLIVFSRDLDTMGEIGGIETLRFFTSLLQDIVKGITKLLKSNFSEVHIVTDHGFLSFQDNENKFKIHLNKSDFIVTTRRFAIGENVTPSNLLRLPITGLKNKFAYFPGGIHYFKSDTFYHGGISLQETIIPYLVVRSKTDEPTKIDVKLGIESGIFNRIFDVTIKPVYEKLGQKPRTVEVLCLREQEIISNKPATMVEEKEEVIRLRLTNTKYLKKGEKIKIVAQDQETQEVLSEIEVEIMIDISEEVI